LSILVDTIIIFLKNKPSLYFLTIEWLDIRSKLTFHTFWHENTCEV
jgi:hypothetical protein